MLWIDNIYNIDCDDDDDDDDSDDDEYGREVKIQG